MPMESAINLEEENFQNSLYRIANGIDIENIEELLYCREAAAKRLITGKYENQKLLLEDQIKYINKHIKRYLAL